MRDSETHKQLSVAMLEALKIVLGAGYRRTDLLRTLCDNWWANRKIVESSRTSHKIRASLVNADLKSATWLNTGDLDNREKLLAAIDTADFVSQRAVKLILSHLSRLKKIKVKSLVKDHSVPMNELVSMLCPSDRKFDPNEVENTLTRFYRMGIITQTEHKNMAARKFRGGKEAGLTRSMPAGWHATNQRNPFARYIAKRINPADAKTIRDLISKLQTKT